MVYRREEPGQKKAGALALLVHVLFLGLMVFGVSWQSNEPAAVEVELWSTLPKTASKPAHPAPKPVPRPEPKPEPEPDPKPEPKPRPVKPEPQPEAKPNKAEIELKAKEARRKEDEQKKLRVEELKQQEKKLKQEQEKREAEKQQREKEEKAQQEKKVQQEKQAEKLRQQQAQAEAAKALKAQAAARNAAMQSVVGKYTDQIKAKIKSKIILPPDLVGNPQAEFDVILMPTGEVLNLKLTRSSGSSAYNSAVERAIYKAQALPLPPDPSLFGQFRELHLSFKLHED